MGRSHSFVHAGLLQLGVAGLAAAQQRPMSDEEAAAACAGCGGIMLFPNGEKKTD